MTIQVRSAESTTFDERIGKLLAQALNDGWELMTPPIFVGRRTPSDMNPAVVGSYPYFLILFKKETN